MPALELVQRSAAEILRELAPTYAGLAAQLGANAEICERAAAEVVDLPEVAKVRLDNAAGLRIAAQRHRAREKALLAAADALPPGVTIPWLPEAARG